MLTNRINVTFNMENIDADFDIYKVEKANKDYYKYNILDSAIYEFKALAVQWTFGATALVLFNKGEVTEHQFKESIMKEYEDVKIQKIDLFDSDQCKCFQFKNRLLAQLLMNSMKTPRHDGLRYSNLTGKLFYHNPAWKRKDKLTGKVDFIRFLEIVIDPGMYLNLNHQTFRRVEREEFGTHVIDSKTGEFRKKLNSDSNITAYKKGSLKHCHFRVDNFDMTDYEHFCKSKMGIMERFFKDVRSNLSKYMSIKFMERKDVQEYNISKLEKKGITVREYGEMLNKKGVVIVDEIGTEKSKKMVDLLSRELLEYYGVVASIGNLTQGAYNIRIIHNEEYYIENELPDPHNNIRGYIVQHMTEEAEHFTESSGSSPAVRKIVQELIIKGDVQEKFISIYDWEGLDSGKNWTFVQRKRRKTESGENATHINFANREARCYFDYYRLKIDGNGKLTFDSFCDADPAVSEEWEKICCAYDLMEDKQYRIKNIIDGLLYSDIDNIHAIIETREKTLPNITAIVNMLQETDEKQNVQKDILLQAIDEFGLEYSQYFKNVKKWKNTLFDKEEILTKKEVKKIINMRTNAASKFNRFFHEKFGIWIYGEWRKEEFDAIYQIGNLLNIKYEYNDNDYDDGHTFVYYVGAKSKRISYPNACCIRKVVSLGDKIEYEEMLPLMAVEFVRNNQYTVLPFPYKYLREYMRNNDVFR